MDKHSQNCESSGPRLALETPFAGNTFGLPVIEACWETSNLIIITASYSTSLYHLISKYFWIELCEWAASDEPGKNSWTIYRIDKSRLDDWLNCWNMLGWNMLEPIEIHGLRGPPCLPAPIYDLPRFENRPQKSCPASNSQEKTPTCTDAMYSCYALYNWVIFLLRFHSEIFLLHFVWPAPLSKKTYI